jgi:hypothetical protein
MRCEKTAVDQTFAFLTLAIDEETEKKQRGHSTDG